MTSIENILADNLWQPQSINNDKLLFANEQTEITETLNIEDINIPISYPDVSIFHISHVGSTLLGRLLEGIKDIKIYYEPNIFKQIHDLEFKYRSGLIYKPQYSTKDMCKLNTSLFSRNKISCIKYTSYINQIGHHLLSKDVGKKIFVMCSLKNFVCQCLASEGTSIDIHDFMPMHFKNIKNDLNFNISLDQLNFLDKACLVWASNMKNILNLYNRFGGLIVDFDREMDNLTLIYQLSNYLQMSINPDYINFALSKYSKNIEVSFSYRDRQTELKNVWDNHGNDLENIINLYYNIFNDSSDLHIISDYVY